MRIEDLERAAAYPHPVGHIERAETHISWVLLTGEFAYKLKKPVDFGFLDFSTLERRKTFCDAELLLNRRFAPELYLDVVPVTQGTDGAEISGSGPVIDWAVKMRQFPRDGQMDDRLNAGLVSAEHLVAFADYVAEVHAALPRVAANDSFGTSGAVWAPVKENFEQIAASPFVARAGSVATLRSWSEQTHARLAAFFEARRNSGFVRECHGDLHLSNLVWLDGRARAFDCIEFNASLRWIDVMSDVAFLAMDLETRRRADLAYTFLDRYLERTGDYDGARALVFYLAYRSLVRAKVAALQAQGGSGDTAQLAARFDLHLDYAVVRTKRLPTLLLCCGVAGSGKSWLAERLVPRLPAIRIRSDVERKRLHDLAPTARAAAPPGQGLYGEAATDATYGRLSACAAAALEGGISVIVDATFLDAGRRDTFRSLAALAGARFRILYCTAPEPVLFERVRSRQRAGTDPSDADERVLRAQLDAFAAPPAGADIVTIDTTNVPDWDALLARIAGA